MLGTGIYNTGLQLYQFVVRIAAMAGKSKARKWLDGRKDWQNKLSAAQLGDGSTIWVHAASLGEFEQGRPVLEALRKNYPANKILLTFFSPSGYEVRKDYQGADFVCYLPLDTAKNAREFIEIIKPALAIFIKYEFWYHYLTTLHARNVPTLLVSGIFRPDQIFFKGYGSMFKKLLKQLTHIFVQNPTSLDLLRNIGINQVTVSGDTRFDRVADLLKEQRSVPEIESLSDNRLIVAGSTWPEDEKLLSQWWQQHQPSNTCLILAPHEIHEEHLQAIENLFPDAIRFSLFKTQPATKPKVLIIDNIGMLTILYRYAYLSYVGGGLAKGGIHNVLEPAVYSKPVIIGPVYDKYFEAVELVAAGGAAVVTDLQSLSQILEKLFTEPEFYSKMAATAGKYVQQNIGATEKVLTYIQEKRFLSKA
ncbi:3-deoxy-D-manno-octulosonic acid transferase [Chitinophaga silvatica]|uniref:3-deoxy-D-manno-octulosonic acid transferase n=1 Tax=Chitinophaga silvatica TaxID=2282649 RepID=A0A3E1Y8U5_9BACT|nr:glycosyltransferase N-terminal domain-containing protein [Chitinophaga silvatica]RFS21389.1 3-deoxy-D-manno-octulosonic acid transferase [Chitinophaga silvatica]